MSGERAAFEGPLGEPDLGAVARLLAPDGDPFAVVIAAVRAKRRAAERAIAALPTDADDEDVKDAFRERVRCDAALSVIREARAFVEE